MPSLQSVVEALMLSFGFTEYRTLSRKLVLLVAGLHEQVNCVTKYSVTCICSALSRNLYILYKALCDLGIPRTGVIL